MTQISSSLNGAIGSPLTGVFLLAGLIPFSNVYGAFFGMISGLAFGLFLSYGAFIVKPEYPKLSVNSECYKNLTESTIYINITNLIDRNVLLSKDATNLTGWERIFGLSYTWYSATGILVTILVGILISLLTGGIKERPNEKLMLVYYLKKKRKTTDDVHLNKF